MKKFLSLAVSNLVAKVSEVVKFEDGKIQGTVSVEQIKKVLKIIGVKFMEADTFNKLDFNISRDVGCKVNLKRKSPDGMTLLMMIRNAETNRTVGIEFKNDSYFGTDNRNSLFYKKYDKDYISYHGLGRALQEVLMQKIASANGLAPKPLYFSLVEDKSSVVITSELLDMTMLKTIERPRWAWDNPDGVEFDKSINAYNVTRKADPAEYDKYPENKPKSIKRAIKFGMIKDLARKLFKLNQLGISHGDLNPSNIIFNLDDDDNLAKLYFVDFELASLGGNFKEEASNILMFTKEIFNAKQHKIFQEEFEKLKNS